MDPSVTPEMMREAWNVTPDSLATRGGLVVAPDGRETSEDEKRVLVEQQLGVLQRMPRGQQLPIHSALAAKYLPAITGAFRANHEPVNSSMVLLNSVTATPYFARFSTLPAGAGIAMLQAQRMAAADFDPESMPAKEVSEACQFLSTVLILQGAETVRNEDREPLLERLKGWKRRFRTGFPVETAERCIGVLSGVGEMAEMSKMMRVMLTTPLESCGWRDCQLKKTQQGNTLMQCGRCKCAVYHGTPEAIMALT